MIQLDTMVRERLELPFLPMTDEGAEELPEAIAKVAQRLSQQAKLIYIEAEFFGGKGQQASALFENGVHAGRVSVAPDAINAALRWLESSRVAAATSSRQQAST